MRAEDFSPEMRQRLVRTVQDQWAFVPEVLPPALAFDMPAIRQIIEAERSGQKIPGYKVLGKLGAGAMAAVFKAKQISLDRHVAIKVLPRKFSSNPQFIERFYAEGRAAAQLNHPNIVQAYDVGKAGDYQDAPWIAGLGEPPPAEGFRSPSEAAGRKPFSC